MTREVEVLAPAGSLDICKAVIRAGADAVYLGGDMFGARAYAGNLNRDELLEAIDFAHIRGAKIYLTVNTLLKEREITGQLLDYMLPYYEAGLDAAIVQDLGVFRLLHRELPELPLHASTQMTITGSCGAALLKSMGASRIVTARELTADEIRQIHSSVGDIEIESFVHGALCYCYSGQCLLSSMNGNRSGNRGRCAQSCRLAYDVTDGNQKINSKNEAYPLSPKDMCTLRVLPDVIDAGVYSLKIEGRMKNVTYAAEVTRIYRRYADMYLKNGREGYRVSQSDIDELMDIYNRGGFNQGYYTQEKGRAMMSVERPNHMGTPALEVVENVNGRVRFRALRDINPQDVFEIDSENSFTSGENVKEGASFTVNLPRRYPLRVGRRIYRTRNGLITQRVTDDFVQNTRNGNVPVDMQLKAYAGEPLKLTLSALGFTVNVCGDIVEKAQNSSADAGSVKQKLMKLGNTAFVAGRISADIGENVFLPVAWINDIRRQGIEKLSDAVLQSYKRTCRTSGKLLETADGDVDEKNKKNTDETRERRLSILVSDDKQLLEISALLNDGEDDGDVKAADTIYIEREALSDAGKSAIEDLCGTDVRLVGALPHIITQNDHKKTQKLIKEFLSLGIDTFLVRNIEEIGLLGETAQGSGVITDANLYCWNSFSVKMLKEMVEACGLRLERITYPYELTADEIREIGKQPGTDGFIDTELIIDAWIPVMVSKQCVKRTYGKCDHACGLVTLSDKKNRDFEVVSKCDYCYSLMYSCKRLQTDADSALVKTAAPSGVRIELAVGDSYDDLINVTKEKEFKAHLLTGVE